MQELIISALLGVLGVIAHSAMKYKSLKEKATAGNIKFSFGEYVSQDAASIVLSLCAVGVWLFVFDEVAKHYQQFVDYKRVSFFAMGFLGSYVIQYFMSVADKKITAIIDTKANAVDGNSIAKTNINSQTQNK